MAGCDRARVQPHPERRHASQHAPDRRELRHSGHRAHRPHDSARPVALAQLFGSRRPGAVAGHGGRACSGCASRIWRAGCPPLVRLRPLAPSFDPAELEQIRLAPMVSGTPPPPAPTPLTPAAQLALLPLAVIATIRNPGAAQLTAAAAPRGGLTL